MVVFFSILVNFPRFFMYVLINDHNSTNGTDTPRIYYKPSSLLENASFNLYYMNVFYSSIVLILPLLILVVFNFAIIHAIRKSANSMRRNSMNMKGGKQEKNLTVVMIVIIVELLLCHSLDRVLLVLKHVMPPSASKCPNSLNYASHASNLLIIINSATDFFIYVIFKKRFRKLLRNMCSCLACCREKRKVSTSQRPSSCSQLSNDINKIDILKQMELKSGQYKQLTSSNSFRNERSPSDSVFLPAGGTPLLSRIKSKTLRG